MDTLLFYSPGACSLAAHIVLEWIGQPYALCKADAKARQTAAFVRINPLRQVPVLRVDGEVLCQNQAILTYLAELKPGILPPHGTKERAKANQWMAYIGTTLHNAFKPHLRPQRYSPYPAHAQPIAETARDAVRECLSHIDHALRDHAPLVGRHDTAADAYLFSISRWARKFVDMPRQYPNLHMYQERLERDPAVAFCLKVEGGDTAKVKGRSYTGHQEL